MTDPKSDSFQDYELPDDRELIVYIDGPSDPLTGLPDPALQKFHEADRENRERYLALAKLEQEKRDARCRAQRKSNNTDGNGSPEVGR